jgi:hypothetical protein
LRRRQFLDQLEVHLFKQGQMRAQLDILICAAFARVPGQRIPFFLRRLRGARLQAIS